jgi:CheY-like chemotaxis protein
MGGICSSKTSTKKVFPLLLKPPGYEKKDNVESLYLSCSRKSQIKDVSFGLCKLTGFTKTELMKENGLRLLVGPDFFSQHCRIVAHAFEQLSANTLRTCSFMREPRRMSIYNSKGTYMVLFVSLELDSDTDLVRADISEHAVKFSRHHSPAKRQAHDIRTPLQSLKATVELMREDAQTITSTKQNEDDLNVNLEIASSSIAEIERILNDRSGIISVTKNHLPKANIKEKDVRDLVRSQLISLCPQLAPGVLLYLYFSDTLYPTKKYGENIEMAQIASLTRNILSNAIKYTQKGQIKVYIWSSSVRTIIRIQDTGSGIAMGAFPLPMMTMEELPKLPQIHFHHFLPPCYSSQGRDNLVNSNIDPSSSGFGGWIILKVLKLFPKTLQLKGYSTMGFGTTFDIFYSFMPSLNPRVSSQESVGNTRILVIDDVESTVKIMGRMVSHLFPTAKVTMTQKFEEAIQHLQEHTFHTIITDLDYGVGNNGSGIELADAVSKGKKDIKNYKKLRYNIVLLHGGSKDLSNDEQDLFHSIWIKPCSKGSIISFINNVCPDLKSRTLAPMRKRGR